MDNQTVNRTELITNVLLDWRAEHVEIRDIDKADWDATVASDPTNLHKPFGFMPPIEDAEGTFMVVSTEIIDEQTRQLDDDQLTDYVGTLMFHCNLHLTNAERYEGRDPMEIERMIEVTILSIEPVTAQMVSEVQMAAL